jgi:hypothetical protein
MNMLPLLKQVPMSTNIRLEEINFEEAHHHVYIGIAQTAPHGSKHMPRRNKKKKTQHVDVCTRKYRLCSNCSKFQQTYA